MNTNHYQLLKHCTKNHCITLWNKIYSEYPEKADLRGANLRRAYLRGVDLRCADLRGANLEDANLEYIIVNCYGWHEIYTPKNIQIGCESHSIEEWKQFTEEQIAEMDSNALEWWKKHKKRVLSMAIK